MLLDGAPFKAISERRDDWKSPDYYRCPGPLQFSTGESSTRTLMSLPAQPSCRASLSPLKQRSEATSTVRLLISVCLPWRRNVFLHPEYACLSAGPGED